MDSDVQKYMKAIIALVAAIAAAIATGVGNGDIGNLSSSDWISIALVILGGTALTWFVENVPGVAGGIIKAFTAASTAGLTALQTGYLEDNHLSQGEVLTAVGAFLVALTVTYQVPNAPDSPASPKAVKTA